MKMIDELRRENLAALVAELGSVKALADRLGKDESQVSQWVNGSTHSKTGKPRGMRKETARFIETKCGKQAGWLDQDQDGKTTVTVAALTVQMFALPCPKCGKVSHKSFIELELNDRIRCACGHNVPVSNYYGIAQLQTMLECFGSPRLALRKR